MAWRAHPLRPVAVDLEDATGAAGSGGGRVARRYAVIPEPLRTRLQHFFDRTRFEGAALRYQVECVIAADEGRPAPERPPRRRAAA